MSITCPITFVPYFTANLTHYFYNLKTTWDLQKTIVHLEYTSKTTSIDNIILIENKYTE